MTLSQERRPDAQRRWQPRSCLHQKQGNTVNFSIIARLHLSCKQRTEREVVPGLKGRSHNEGRKPEQKTLIEGAARATDHYVGRSGSTRPSSSVQAEDKTLIERAARAQDLHPGHSTSTGPSSRAQPEMRFLFFL